MERRGARLMELRATLSGRFNTPDAEGIIGEVFNPDTNGVYYNYKHFFSPDWTSFDYAPRLVRGDVKRRPKYRKAGEAEIALCSTPCDPWSEIEIARVLGATYTVADSSMLKANLVAEADPMAFAPYAFLKGD